MKKFSWKRNGWFAKDFLIKNDEKVIGQLVFKNTWRSNAAYLCNDSKLIFAQKSFFDKDVLIVKDQKIIGHIYHEFFGGHTLKLASGGTYFLSTSLWEQEVYWKNEQEKKIIIYQQAALSSLGNGLINVSDSITPATENILVSCGLYLRQLSQNRRATTVAILVPLLAAANM